MVCASAGNLGQALAYSGPRRGLEVTVVAARTANPLKLRQIAAFGADVRLEGEDIEDARLLAREIAEADGAYLVEDSLDLATCEGAATIGLELVRDDPELDVVLVALGGGAMASGVGYVVRSLAEHVEVIGIQPVGAPAMALSWRQGTVVETDRIETIADGVAGRCPIPEVLDDLLVVLDDVVLVREDSIKAGMRALYEHAGLVVEPSAALGIAAVLEQPERFAGRRVTTILCGSNVAPADFARWVLEPHERSTTAASGRQRWSHALREHGDRVGQRPPNAHATAELGDLRPGRALDAGCGHGSDTLWLAARGWQVTAVDFAATALAYARSTAESMGPDVAERIDWVEGDLATWTPPAGRVRLVVCLIPPSSAPRQGSLAAGPSSWSATARSTRPPEPRPPPPGRCRSPSTPRSPPSIRRAGR